MNLRQLTRPRLEEVVRLYLAEAFPEGRLPLATQARLQWPAGETLADLALGPAFERRPHGAPPDACQRIRLRLGNSFYPHMKLGVDRVPDSEDWVLVVDSHDRPLLAAVAEHERVAVEELIQKNTVLKERIERRWREAGLPTFEQYIRDRLRRR